MTFFEFLFYVFILIVGTFTIIALINYLTQRNKVVELIKKYKKGNFGLLSLAIQIIFIPDPWYENFLKKMNAKLFDEKGKMHITGKIVLIGLVLILVIQIIDTLLK